MFIDEAFATEPLILDADAGRGVNSALLTVSEVGSDRDVAPGIKIVRNARHLHVGNLIGDFACKQMQRGLGSGNGIDDEVGDLIRITGVLSIQLVAVKVG